MKHRDVLTYTAIVALTGIGMAFLVIACTVVARWF